VESTKSSRRKSNGKKLATIKAIDRAERQLIARLKRYFASGLLTGYEEQMQVGIDRIQEQAALARTLLVHMQERGIPNIETLAKKLWFDKDAIEYFEYLRYPTDFDKPNSDDAEYLLSLCDLDVEVIRRTQM